MSPRLSAVTLEATGVADLPEEIEQERKVAIFDLLEENSFAPHRAPAGPYRLTLGLEGGTLAFDVTTEAGEPAATFDLTLGQLRQIAKDYREICASYHAAVVSSPPSEIEAFDEARRAIHGEGAAFLQKRLEDNVEIDLATAKRLFTLVYVLTAGE